LAHRMSLAFSARAAGVEIETLVDDLAARAA
jgi:hypothetical protein